MRPLNKDMKYVEKEHYTLLHDMPSYPVELGEGWAPETKEAARLTWALCPQHPHARHRVWHVPDAHLLCCAEEEATPEEHWDLV